MEALSGVSRLDAVASTWGGYDGFVEVLVLVMNSIPTSINSSRGVELLGLTLGNDENDFTGSTDGVDTRTDNTATGSIKLV